MIGDKNRLSLLNFPVLCALCDSWAPSGIIGNRLYVIILGIVGAAITTFDVIRIMNYKLPAKYSFRSSYSDIVPLTLERDLKSMVSVIVIEHYTLIMLGAITEYPILHIPWLVMQLCVIIVEIGEFFISIIVNGLHIRRAGFFQAIIIIFHWIQRHYLNTGEKISQSTLKDSESNIFSKAETLYVSLMCLVTSCLSSVTFEVGARSPLGHSVTKSATFNALFRRNYNMIIKIPMGDFVSSLISTITLSFGEKYRIPYFYIPWLVNTLRGMIFNEGPALLSLSYNQIPYAVIPASTFGFMTIILFAEELCLWCDVFSSFQRCWIDYKNYKEYTKKNEKYNNSASAKMNRKSHDCEQKIHGKIVDYTKMKSKIFNTPDRPSGNPSDLRQTKSLIAIKYLHDD
ncbi:hypothetical protein PV328_010666 [Microctonus aethiopoides]|uniref:Uncharacterized protein n=1 Tax=Microctonus aethiopoides TaxID=144406 RepID=A0AA39FIN7_9HYME|nr:hypothetical protein PV328_010666 [Microctonus aethiopoides]